MAEGEKRIEAVFPTGSIRVRWNELGRRPYFEVHYSIQAAEGLSMFETRGFKEAREALNRRMEGLLGDCGLKIRQLQHGRSGEIYSLSFRVAEHRWTSIELAKFCDLLQAMKVH